MFKLIVVDDSEIIRVTLVKFFNHHGITTLGFDDGSSALEYLKNNNVDVVLSDIMMPDISGPDMAQVTQQNRSTPPIIVFMTGASDFDIRTTYLAGARAVLLKPISAEDLLKLLTYFYQERESLRHSAT